MVHHSPKESDESDKFDQDTANGPLAEHQHTAPLATSCTGPPIVRSEPNTPFEYS